MGSFTKAEEAMQQGARSTADAVALHQRSQQQAAGAAEWTRRMQSPMVGGQPITTYRPGR